MSAKSISMCQGRGSIAHNNREYFCKNVDPERAEENKIYKQQPIAEAYQECFGKAQARYNEKQKRADRQIDCYFENLFGVDPKTQKAKSTLTAPSKQISFYEDLVQIGTKDDTPEEKAVHAVAVDEYMQGFQDRNSQFHVFNAVLHRDEATPHGHINWIPFATGYKNGLEKQNGLAKALEQMGYGKGKYAIDRWRQSERKVLEKICERHGVKIKPPEKSRGSLSVEEYKNEKDDMRTKISAELEAERAEIASEISNLQNKANFLEKGIFTNEDRLKEQENTILCNRDMILIQEDSKKNNDKLIENQKDVLNILEKKAGELEKTNETAAVELEKLLGELAAAKEEAEAEYVKLEGKIAGNKKIIFAKENAKPSDFGKSTKIKNMTVEEFNMILKAASDRVKAADRAKVVEERTAADVAAANKKATAAEKRAETAQITWQPTLEILKKNGVLVSDVTDIPAIVGGLYHKINNLPDYEKMEKELKSTQKELENMERGTSKEKGISAEMVKNRQKEQKQIEQFLQLPATERQNLLVKANLKIPKEKDTPSRPINRNGQEL
jgi:hypothetical protein